VACREIKKSKYASPRIDVYQSDCSQIVRTREHLRNESCHAVHESAEPRSAAPPLRKESAVAAVISVIAVQVFGSFWASGAPLRRLHRTTP
jgi:hypothetical protein